MHRRINPNLHGGEFELDAGSAALPLLGVTGQDYALSDEGRIRTWTGSEFVIPDSVYLEDDCPHPCPAGKFSKLADGYW